MGLSRRLFLAGTSTSIVAPAAASEQVSPEHFASHWEARQAIINARAVAEGPGGVALIGDSISEVMWWPDLAGHRVVNMGFGAARVRQILQHVQKPLEQAKPDFAILMTSINNAIVGLPSDEDQSFERDFRLLLDTVRSSVNAVAVSTITPVESGKQLSAIYSNDRVISLNDTIKAVCIDAQVEVFDTFAAVSAIPDVTFDGVHLNSRPYRDIREVYEAAVRTF